MKNVEMRKPQWIYFYLWKHGKRVVYIGQSICVESRNKFRETEDSRIGRFLRKHHCELQKLQDIRVWDVPQGKWANCIENALIDLYKTLVPFGCNGCYSTQKGLLNYAKLGQQALSREILSSAGAKGARRAYALHPKLAFENGKRFAAYAHLGPSAQPHWAKVKGGRIIGRRNVETGHWASLKTQEHQSKAGKAGARAGGGIAPHTRWHLKRGQTSLDCKFCVRM